MAELLLRERTVASDAASLSQALQSVFGVGTAALDVEGDLVFDQLSLVDDGVSATWVSCAGAPLTVVGDAAPDLVVIAVRSGGLRLQVGARSTLLGSGDIGVVPLGSATVVQWDEVVFEAFSFPPQTVARLLGSTSTDLRLHASRLRAESSAVITLWQRTASVLGQEVLQSKELYESDMVREQTIAALLGVTIEAFGVTSVAEDDRRTDRVVLDRADRFMRAHLGDPITVGDMAHAARVSVRGLQLAFQRLDRGTPVLHLRQLRMHAAHVMLKAAAERDMTVGSVARSLSYTNLGRFSAHYRGSFGEAPGETLRRARQSTRA